MKTAIYTLLLIILATNAFAQRSTFADSSVILNDARLQTNKRGMEVLGSWGIANIVVGAAGYFTAKDDKWKAFHGMNAIWGVVNTGIAGAGLVGVRKEMAQKLDCSGYFQRYESTRRLYLLNAGLDVLYIGTGAFLTEHARNVSSDPSVWRGFGRSIAMQGIFLLVFDNVMFAAHSRQSKRWYHLLQGVCVTGNGVGFNYTF